MSIGEWLREAAERRRRKAYLEVLREDYIQGYANAKAGLPRLPPGSEINSLCRLGLIASNPADLESQPCEE